MPMPHFPYTKLEHTKTYVRANIQPNASAGYSPFGFDLILALITYEMNNGMTVGEPDKHSCELPPLERVSIASKQNLDAG